MHKTWLIYGANGYIGKMLVYESIKEGLAPILAGRNGQKIFDLARETQLPCRVFDLTSKFLNTFLEDCSLVVNCAGPYSTTSQKLLEACCETQTHYLDLSNEVWTYESIFEHANKWIRHDITVIPGLGFEVIPGDCLSAYLKRMLPDATKLSLGLSMRGTRASKGHLRSFVEAIAYGGRIRSEGHLKKVPLAWKTKLIPYHALPSLSVAMPSPELSSSWMSTRIPNIETYVEMSTRSIRYLKMLRLFRPFLFIKPFLSWVKKQLKHVAQPPHSRVYQKGKGTIWGEVQNHAGVRKEFRIHTNEAYQFTCQSVIVIVKKVLSGSIGRGCHTPSTALGPDFILTCNHITIEDIKPPKA